VFSHVERFIELVEDAPPDALYDSGWREALLDTSLRVFGAESTHLVDPCLGVVMAGRSLDQQPAVSRSGTETLGPDLDPAPATMNELPDPWRPLCLEHTISSVLETGSSTAGVTVGLVREGAGLHLTIAGFPGPEGNPTRGCLRILRVLAPALKLLQAKAQQTAAWRQHLEMLAQAVSHPAGVAREDGELLFENRASREHPQGFHAGQPVLLRTAMAELLRREPGQVCTLDDSAHGWQSEPRVLRGFLMDCVVGTSACGLLWLAPTSRRLPETAELASRFNLTDRESEVALLLCRGLSTKKIAARLDVSWHTARGHVERCLKKLDASSRAQVPLRVLL